MSKTTFNNAPNVTAQRALQAVKKRDLASMVASAEWVAAMSQTGPTINILDLGCGKGEFAAMYLDWILSTFQDKHVNYTGVDAYGPKLEYANDRLSLDLRSTKIQDLGVGVSGCDLVVMSHSAYYIKNELLTNDAFLRNAILRRLKPGGLLVVIAMTQDYNDHDRLAVYAGKYEHLCTQMKFEKEVYSFIESPDFDKNPKGLYLTNGFALTYEQIAACLRRYSIRYSEVSMPTVYLSIGNLEDYQNNTGVQDALRHLTRNRSDSLDAARMDYLVNQLKGCTCVGDGEFELAHIAKIAFVFN